MDGSNGGNDSSSEARADKWSGDPTPATAPSRHPSLVVNALSSWAGFVVTLVTGFLLTPFIITHLGKNGYGIWCLVGSVIGYYGLLDLGVSAAVRRYVARYAARGDHEALNDTVGTALTVFAAVGAAMIIVSILAGRPMAAFFGISGSSADAFYAVVVLLGLSAAVNIVGQVLRATIAAHELFVVRNSVIAVAVVVRAGMTVWTLLSGWGLFGVAVAYLAVDGLQLAVYVHLVKRLTPHVRLRLGVWRWRRARRLFTYGLTMTVIVGAGIVQAHTASLVLAKVVSLEAVAVYAVAAMLMRHFCNLIQAGMGVLNPRFAGLHGVNDLSNLRRLMVKALWVATILSCMVALVVLILGRRFLHLWVGARFSPAELDVAVTVLMILVVTYALGLSQTPGAAVLYAMNRHRAYAWIMVAEAACNLLLSVLLAVRMGTVGVATAALVSLLAVRTAAQPLYIAKVVGLPLRRYCLPIIAPTLAAAVVYGLWNWLLRLHTPAMGYMGLVVAGACITLTYLLVMAAMAAAVDLARGRRVRWAVLFASSTTSSSLEEGR